MTDNNAAYIQSLEKSLERQHNEKMELLRTIETQSRLIDRLNYMLEDYRRRDLHNTESRNQMDRWAIGYSKLPDVPLKAYGV